MATMDVFNADPFTTLSLTAAVERVPRIPAQLDGLGIFEPNPVPTTSVEMEEREGTIRLIQTDARGAPPKNRTAEKRKMRSAKIHRLAESDTIYSDQIQNVRAFGTESELMQMQAEVARRYAGPTGILRDFELTLENMRLGAVQGIVVDADGSTLDDWFDFWGVTQPTEIDFDLDAASPASGALRKKCAQVVRAMADAAKMGGFGGWMPHALMGRNFADDFFAHVEVRETYKNWTAAAELRQGAAFVSGFSFGGIVWHEYNGTEDNRTVAVGTDNAKFFPVGAPGIFQVAWGPGEGMQWANRPGRPQYAILVRDLQRDHWVQPEVYSYPLYYCTRPLMLQRAKRT